ncbi:hypothetical protein E4U52_005320 [Claviceps spartinae]|nr:hypothetical protein E4U52_005320 [Claviceps spartinae]
MRSRDEELFFELKPLAATESAEAATDEAVPVGNDTGTCGLVQSRHPQAKPDRIAMGAICKAGGLVEVGRTRSATADEQCNKDKDCLTVQTLDSSIEKAVQMVL